MNVQQFRALHKDLRINIPRTYFKNGLPSATDPTQDVPLKMVQIIGDGIPLNVKKHDMPFNNVKAENLTSIERRNNDVFDIYGEFQQTGHSIARKGVETDYVKPDKKLSHYEI